MSRLSQQPGVKRLNIGGGGGGGSGTEFLLIGALALIIVGSLFLGVRQGCGPSRTAVEPQEVFYFCQKCKQKFKPDPNSLAELEMYAPMGIMRLDCPLCGAKKSAVPMVKCPNCGEYYVSPQLAYEEQMMMGRDLSNVQMPKDICPHCGTDRMQWYREHRRR
jgi:ribosomal protein L32